MDAATVGVFFGGWVLTTARLCRLDARLRRVAGHHAVGARRGVGVVHLVLAGMVLVA